MPAVPDAASQAVNPVALLIDIKALSVLLSRSEASLERDQAAGRLPAPVRIGGSRLWRRAEIEDWVAAGCPDAARWEVVKTARATSA